MYLACFSQVIKVCFQNIDIEFFYLRIGLFFTDHEIIRSNIEKAKEMLEEGGDWDRRNRLKVNI